ncbi:MAG: hypothetical protein KF847_12800 [Pirellulales bacterium]|nr:hypothetical protein [Pirellulales bacterium]
MPVASHASDRLRKVAILVASLDGPLADQLLAQLSPADGRRVEEQLQRLNEIDPDEREQVLAEFRGAVVRRETFAATSDSGSSERIDGVEAEFSAESEAAALKPATMLALRTSTRRGPLDRAEPTEIANLLASEHPQTVALVLTRLDEEQASAVFALLAPELQTETVDRLANLDAADAEILTEIEQQLARRLEDRQQRQARMAAGGALAMKMLAKTPPDRRAALLARISRPCDGGTQASIASEQDLAAGRETFPTAVPPASASEGRLNRLRDRLRTAVRLPRRERRREGALETNESRIAEETVPDELPPSEITAALLRLDASQIAAALGRVDDRTARLALAASGNELLNRLAARLPRRQAAALRRRVAEVGPATLAEFVAAQRAVLAAAPSPVAPLTRLAA